MGLGRPLVEPAAEQFGCYAPCVFRVRRVVQWTPRPEVRGPRARRDGRAGPERAPSREVDGHDGEALCTLQVCRLRHVRR